MSCRGECRSAAYCIWKAGKYRDGEVWRYQPLCFDIHVMMIGPYTCRRWLDPTHVTWCRCKHDFGPFMSNHIDMHSIIFLSFRIPVDASRVSTSKPDTGMHVNQRLPRYSTSTSYRGSKLYVVDKAMLARRSDIHMHTLSSPCMHRTGNNNKSVEFPYLCYHTCLRPYSWDYLLLYSMHTIPHTIAACLILS